MRASSWKPGAMAKSEASVVACGPWGGLRDEMKLARHALLPNLAQVTPIGPNALWMMAGRSKVLVFNFRKRQGTDVEHHRNQEALQEPGYRFSRQPNTPSLNQGQPVETPKACMGLEQQSYCELNSLNFRLEVRLEASILATASLRGILPGHSNGRYLHQRFPGPRGPPLVDGLEQDQRNMRRSRVSVPLPAPHAILRFLSTEYGLDADLHLQLISHPWSESTESQGAGA
jgi:hypothetical protein